MDKPEQVVLTNLCMIQDGSRVLVEDKISKWGCGIFFPGGHVEEHEPIVDSVIREVREETGLTIENPRLCGIKEWIKGDGSRYMVFLFRAEKYTGTLSSSEEGRVFWMEKDQVLKSNWIWHLDDIMKVMEEPGPAELYLDENDNWKPVLK